MDNYLRPTDLSDALAALADGPVSILAGGTDFYPARVGRRVTEDVLDLSALAELRGIQETDEGYALGALATWSDLLATPLPPAFDGLKQAAREVGGVQIQNAGTIVGNVCNASPAADGIPNLLCLDAEVELRSRDDTRRLPLADFVRGNRTTARGPNELVTRLLVPKPAERARSIFLKLGARRYLVISIVMVAAVIEEDASGTIADARIAVGSCSETAKRLTALEGALIGKTRSAASNGLLNAEHFAPLSPIDDVRGTADYRRDAVATLVRRAVDGQGSAAA